MIVGNDTFYIRPLNDQGSNRISDEHVWVNSKDEPHYFKCGTGMSVLIYHKITKKDVFIIPIWQPPHNIWSFLQQVIPFFQRQEVFSEEIKNMIFFLNICNISSDDKNKIKGYLV